MDITLFAFCHELIMIDRSGQIQLVRFELSTRVLRDCCTQSTVRRNFFFYLRIAGENHGLKDGIGSIEIWGRPYEL
jgi:hypothetical protein